MTQMSCGMYARENLHGQSVGTSSNLVTSRSGAMLSSRKAHEAQPHIGTALGSERPLDTTTKKKAGMEFSSLRFAPGPQDDGELRTKRT